MSQAKQEFLARSKEFWNPGKTQDWIDMGVDLVIDHREGYYLFDMDGRRLIDMHLNGGTYNLGHRHPELVEVLKAGTARFDMGNHHFPALARTALAEALQKCAPGPDFKYTAYGSGGGEAIDIAIKTARHTRRKRKIVSIIKAYHGHTGLAVKTGDDRFSKLFLAIVDAVATCAHEHSGYFAEAAVKESGFGVAAHKKIKNELTAHPLVDFYRDQDFVNARVDEARKIVELPRPAGVIFALTPSTNPIATLHFKILMALMTRNAIVISPHPAVRKCSVQAARALCDAAEAAGAPKSIIQIIDEPTIPMVETFMKSPKTNVILATGGTPMVRSAYSSSNPAIGVGPGNAPVYVDASADISKAAKRIVLSKSFDNSVLCTNESVLITTRDVENQLVIALKAADAYICSDDDTQRLRRFLFHPNGFNIEAIGRDAIWIAQECGIRVPSKTKILVTPITQIGVEERLSKEKLCPVLALHVAPSRNLAMVQARAVLRLTGAGHSAAIHAKDETVVMQFAGMVEAYRVVVNAPCSQGAAGFATNLAPTFTIGTGFFGRSSIGENVGPQHLVHWTRIAYNSDADEPFGNYHGLRRSFRGPLAEAPADGVPGSPAPRPFTQSPQPSALDGASKDALRRLIAEELRDLLRR